MSGVDVPQMVADGRAARDGRPVIGLSRLDRESIDQLTGWVRGVLSVFRSGSHVAVDPGPMAPHSHADEGGQAQVHRHGDGEPHSTVRTAARRSHAHRTQPRVTLIGVAAAPGRARLTLTDGPIGARIISTTDSGARIGLVAQTALLLGGDHIELDIEVGPDAWLELIETAGTVVYDAGGVPSSWTVRIRIAEGGTLIWAGEPFVVSRGANVRRSTVIELGSRGGGVPAGNGGARPDRRDGRRGELPDARHAPGSPAAAGGPRPHRSAAAQPARRHRRGQGAGHRRAARPPGAGRSGTAGRVEIRPRRPWNAGPLAHRGAGRIRVDAGQDAVGGRKSTERQFRPQRPRNAAVISRRDLAT